MWILASIWNQVIAGRPTACLRVCMCIRVCVSEAALQSAGHQTALPTHGFTPPHSDTVMSHMLHSYTFVLTASCWDILTLVSPSHTCTQTLSPRFNKRCTFLKDMFKKFHLQSVLQPIFVLTVNCAKLMNSSATSLCQHCSNQALTWHQQNCLSAFLSNGCHSAADRGTWAKK